MNPNDRKQRRRALTRCFFFHNRTAAFLAMSAVILNIPLNLAVAWQMQQLIDIAAGSPSAFTLPQISAALALSFAVMAAIMALGSYARPLFIERAVRQYRDYTFEQLTRKSTAAFHTENTSAYLSALTNDTVSIETNYLPALFTLPGNLLLLIGSFALMLYYSIPLTLAAAAAALLPLAASLMAGSRLSCQEKKVSDQNESFMAALQDMLSGFPVIKSFKAKPEAVRLFSLRNAASLKSKCSANRTRIILQNICAAAGQLALFLVFMLGALLAIKGYGVTAGVVLVFVQLMDTAESSISQLPQIWANRSSANALIDKLAAALSCGKEQNGIPAPHTLQVSITLQNLSFSYSQEIPVLQNINYCFEAGKNMPLWAIPAAENQPCWSSFREAIQAIRGKSCMTAGSCAPSGRIPCITLFPSYSRTYFSLTAPSWIISPCSVISPKKKQRLPSAAPGWNPFLLPGAPIPRAEKTEALSPAVSGSAFP